MIFQEIDEFAARIPAAAEAGAQGVEFWAWRNKDLDAVKQALKQTGLQLAAFCVEPMGRIVDPATHETFLQGVRESVRTAADLGCSRLIVTTGQELEGVERAAQREAIVAALKKAAPIAEDGGVALVLEPLNVLVDHKGYYLSSSYEAYEIVDEVGSPAVKALFDIYHQQVTEGNLIANIQAHIDKIGHFHLADVPGRREPGTGEIHYANVFKAIEETRYSGWVGMEFRPSAASAEAVRRTVSFAE